MNDPDLVIGALQNCSQFRDIIHSLRDILDNFQAATWTLNRVYEYFRIATSLLLDIWGQYTLIPYFRTFLHNFQAATCTLKRLHEEKWNRTWHACLM